MESNIQELHDRIFECTEFIKECLKKRKELRYIILKTNNKSIIKKYVKIRKKLREMLYEIKLISFIERYNLCLLALKKITKERTFTLVKPTIENIFFELNKLKKLIINISKYYEWRLNKRKYIKRVQLNSLKDLKDKVSTCKVYIQNVDEISKILYYFCSDNLKKISNRKNYSKKISEFLIENENVIFFRR